MARLSTWNGGTLLRTRYGLGTTSLLGLSALVALAACDAPKVGELNNGGPFVKITDAGADDALEGAGGAGGGVARQGANGGMGGYGTAGVAGVAGSTSSSLGGASGAAGRGAGGFGGNRTSGISGAGGS